MRYKPLPNEDLAAVAEQAALALEALRGSRIFVTGGTGFFGHWMLESLLRANREMELEMEVTLLTRDVARFRGESPWIANDESVKLIEGDLRSFVFPSGGFSHVIHAATDSGGQQRSRTADELYEEISDGTRRVLEFARESGVRRVLYVSTGAVYGRSTTVRLTPESYGEEHDVLLLPGSYEAAKRSAEELCLEATNSGEMECVIARPFAFVGPRLPLDTHFAIGNFLKAAIRGESIVVKGDGTPRRSWMYMSDLAVWMWTLLARGTNRRAYNVGSEEVFSIRAAAELTAGLLGRGIGVEVQGVPPADGVISNYAPSVARAQEELGLRVTVPLEDALRKTARWYSELLERD